VVAGVKAIREDRDLLMVASLVSLQTVVAGALIVFNVVIAIQVLDTNADGVGYLEAVLGLGAIAGGLFAIAHASHDRLAWDLRLGVLLWSLPLVLVAVIPEAVSAFVAMALIGFANAVVYVTYVIILQRRTPEAVQGLVFGAVGGMLVGAMALGSFAAPYLIDWLGLRWALAVVGGVVAGLVLPWSPRVRHLDGAMAEPDGLALLRSIGFFQALSPPALDALARRLGERTAAPGEVILRQGESSDRFFVIEAGRVKVVQDGRELREEGPGEFFGEIGLLRDEPRSATVTAVEPTVLRTLDREVFLPVVTGNERASTALEDVVTRRLAV
jgi:MFS family permease